MCKLQYLNSIITREEIYDDVICVYDMRLSDVSMILDSKDAAMKYVQLIRRIM